MTTNTLVRPDFRLALDEVAKLKLSWPNITLIYAYLKTLLPVALAALLIALFLRITFGLFIIEGQFASDINTLTQPFVFPFEGMFLTENKMLQAPAFAAFSFYYTGYYSLGRFFKWYHGRPSSGQPNLSI